MEDEDLRKTNEEVICEPWVVATTFRAVNVKRPATDQEEAVILLKTCQETSRQLGIVLVSDLEGVWGGEFTYEHVATLCKENNPNLEASPLRLGKLIFDMMERSPTHGSNSDAPHQSKVKPTSSKSTVAPTLCLIEAAAGQPDPEGTSDIKVETMQENMDSVEVENKRGRARNMMYLEVFSDAWKGIRLGCRLPLAPLTLQSSALHLTRPLALMLVESHRQNAMLSSRLRAMAVEVELGSGPATEKKGKRKSSEAMTNTGSPSLTTFNAGMMKGLLGQAFQDMWPELYQKEIEFRHSRMKEPVVPSVSAGVSPPKMPKLDPAIVEKKRREELQKKLEKDAVKMEAKKKAGRKKLAL